MRADTFLAVIISALRNAARRSPSQAGDAVLAKATQGGHSRSSRNALFGTLVQTRNS